jgi:hypothetical protein
MALLASVPGVIEGLLIVLLVGLVVAAPIVCALKGKWVFAAFGLVIHILWWVGAVRLAKPNSRWARRYDDDKLAESMRRFPDQARSVDAEHASRLSLTLPELGVPDDHIGQWPEEPPSMWDKTTRRAYKKQYGHLPEDSVPVKGGGPEVPEAHAGPEKP